jgi:hypothetical protein
LFTGNFESFVFKITAGTNSSNRLQLSDAGPIVAIVCGGNMVTVDLFDEWRHQFNLL